MIDSDHELSIGRQAKALGICRSSVYYLPRPTSDADLALMRRIDELHLEYPFAGSRMLQGLLQPRATRWAGSRLDADEEDGHRGALPAPEYVKPAPGHRVYPYLLRKLAVTRPNQVWAMDMTYIPMARGFVYLAAVLDWFSRKVLPGGCRSRCPPTSASRRSKRRSPTGRPEIFNTDQGGQFTGATSRRVLKDAEIAISMDGKGAWRDNVFVERLWRTVKYEEVYLRAYASVSEARASIGRYLGFYNPASLHPSFYAVEVKRFF